MGYHTKSKDLNKVLRELVRQGYRLEISRHIKVHHPDGKRFICSMSPSCPHAHKRLLQDIKRYEKGRAG